MSKTRFKGTSRTEFGKCKTPCHVSEVVIYRSDLKEK